MASRLVRLAQAQKKVRAIEREISDFLSKQHSVRFDVIKKNPNYIELRARLLRAEGVVRYIQRQSED